MDPHVASQLGMAPTAVGSASGSIGYGAVVPPNCPQPVEMMKVWEPWKGYIFDVMALVDMQDVGGQVADVIGHWLVKVLRVDDPAKISAGYAMSLENPRLNQIVNFQQQQVALVVVRVAGAAVAVREVEGNDVSQPVSKQRRIDDTGASSSLELSVKTMIGDGSGDEIQRTVLAYLDCREADNVRSPDMLKNMGLDKVTLGMQPPRVALLACCVANERARMDNTRTWYVYLALTACFPSWLHKGKVGGETGLPAVGAKCSGAGGESISLLRTLDSLVFLKQKPFGAS